MDFEIWETVDAIIIAFDNLISYEAAFRLFEAEELMTLAQEMVNLRWNNYEEPAVKGASDFK